MIASPWIAMGRALLPLRCAHSPPLTRRHPRVLMLTQPSVIRTDPCRKHILLVDRDGSFFGTGAGGSIVARAEFQSAVRADGTTPTAYAIPQSMLYDQTPIGRPTPPPDGGDATKPVPASAVASIGYGSYRAGCVEAENVSNAWLCRAEDVLPARLVIESLDGDTETRSLVPVALASGGYVDLLNGGQDHGWCFGYTCLKRLSTFHATVALGRPYDLAFSGTNPKTLRLMMPIEPPTSKVLIALWYSDPSKLAVIDDASGIEVLDLNAAIGPYSEGLTLPTVESPCGSNAFVGAERKMLVVVCGGDTGIRIGAVPVVVLSIGVSLSVDDFFEPSQLATNLISLLGISADRVAVASVSRDDATAQLVISPAAVCDDVDCGIHGTCVTDESAAGRRRCACNQGFGPEAGCDGWYCQCSASSTRALAQSCARAQFEGASSGCHPCNPSCATCVGGTSFECTACRFGFVLRGQGNCVEAPANPSIGPSGVNISEDVLLSELIAVGRAVANRSAAGTLDVGYDVASVGLLLPPEPTLQAAPSEDNAAVQQEELAPVSYGEIQRMTLASIAGETLIGGVAVSFNGEETREINVGTIDAQSLQSELQGLSTIGTVTVSIERTTEIGGGTSRLDLIVEFTMQGTPRNEGSLPVGFVLVTGATSGLAQATVDIERPGSYPEGYMLAEQKVRLISSDGSLDGIGGDFTLSLDGESTAPIAPDASATAVRQALAELSTVGDVEVFREEVSTAERAWLVRFYLSGEPAHLGPVATMAASSTVSGRMARQLQADLFVGPTVKHSESAGQETGRRLQQASVVIEVIAVGSSPFDLGGNTPPPPPPATDTFVPLRFVQPTHVCGDGVRTTAEGCDDGNVIDGDGCSSACARETGWRCINVNVAFGAYGGVDTCTPICGDGRRVLGYERCDDNNTIAGDGCSIECDIEAGYYCSGGSLDSADVCATPCGGGSDPCVCAILPNGAGATKTEAWVRAIATEAASLLLASNLTAIQATDLGMLVLELSVTGTAVGGDMSTVLLELQANTTMSADLSFYKLSTYDQPDPGAEDPVATESAAGESAADPAGLAEASPALSISVQVLNLDLVAIMTDPSGFEAAIAARPSFAGTSFSVQAPCNSFPPAPPPAPPPSPPNTSDLPIILALGITLPSMAVAALVLVAAWWRRRYKRRVEPISEETSKKAGDPTMHGGINRAMGSGRGATLVRGKSERDEAIKPEKAELGIGPRMKEAEDERAGAEEEVEAEVEAEAAEEAEEEAVAKQEAEEAEEAEESEEAEEEESDASDIYEPLPDGLRRQPSVLQRTNSWEAGSAGNGPRLHLAPPSLHPYIPTSMAPIHTDYARKGAGPKQGLSVATKQQAAAAALLHELQPHAAYLLRMLASQSARHHGKVSKVQFRTQVTKLELPATYTDATVDSLFESWDARGIGVLPIAKLERNLTYPGNMAGSRKQPRGNHHPGIAVPTRAAPPLPRDHA